MGPQLFLDANYDFVGKRNLLLGIAAAVIALCVASLAIKGLNLGVEFTGGAQIEANFREDKQPKVPVDIDAVRSALTDAGIRNPQVLTVGDTDDHAFLIRVQALEQAAGSDLGARIQDALAKKYGDSLAYFDFDEESQDRATARLEGVQPDIAEVRQVVVPALGGVGLEDVTFDKGSSTLVVRLENASNDVLTALTQKFGEGTYDASIDSIGAAVSKDLTRNALLAIAGACVLIGVYVWLRFDWDFAPGVILALVHDAVLVIGVWSIAGRVLGLEGFEFNLTIVAAVLAIIGYSVNDTVVIYDRIRENREKHQSQTLLWVVNKSVNETLSRTVLTSGATLLSVLSIGLLGSESIRWFGWAMTVGILSGTWSTIAVAMPVTMIVYSIRERQQKSAASSTPQAGVRAKG